MARVWDCRNLSHLSSRRRDRRHAELAAVHHRRPGLLDLGGDGDAGRDIAASARRRRRRGRAIGRAGADRDGARRRAHRPPAVRAWSHPRRPRHSVRAVSGDRGISGRDRLGDGQRRGAGDHRRTADHRRSPRAHQLLQPCQTAGGRRGRLCALHRHAATEQKSICQSYWRCSSLPGTSVLLWPARAAQAQANGWLFRAPRSASPWRPDHLAHFPWRSLPALSGDLLGRRCSSPPISMLLNTAGNRVRDAARGRPRTRSQLARDRQPGFGGAGRLCELRFARPAPRSTMRPARAGGCPVSTVAAISADRPVRRSGLCGVRAEVRAGRPAALSRPRPDVSLADRVGQAAVAARIPVARRHRADHRAAGLHRGRADRHRHRLRDVCAEREPRQRDQVRLRRLGIPLLARPQFRASWRCSPGMAASCRA